MEYGTSKGPEGFQTDSRRVQIIPMIILDQFGTIMNLYRALIFETSNWSRTIFCRFLQQTGFKYLIAHLVRLGYSNWYFVKQKSITSKLTQESKPAQISEYVFIKKEPTAGLDKKEFASRTLSIFIPFHGLWLLLFSVVTWPHLLKKNGWGACPDAANATKPLPLSAETIKFRWEHES